MKTQLFLIAAAVVVAFVVIASLDNTPRLEPEFHVILATADAYTDGVYTNNFELDQGLYTFDFTPNGDSPQTLSIKLDGDTFSFEQDFVLDGTLHDTGISQYYTWDYLGEKQINIPSRQAVQLVIDPNGETLGPVSVSIKSLE